jgi:23S rRNA (cytosine1962-C5)-methyltransferase
MPLPTVRLKPQRHDRLGHPWVYDSEIQNGPPASFDEGGCVRVIDSGGRALGVGYMNRKSKIAVRYLTRDPDTVVDAAFWRGRVEHAYAYRQARFAADGGLPAAYRLTHGESDGLPGLVVDVYGRFAVVQFMALGLEPWRETLIRAIADTTHVAGIYERSDSHVRKLEGLDERTGVVFGEDPPAPLEIEDAGATLLVDIHGGAKTGLFLDQRENQLAAAREARGRNVLNCFSYTGIFGLRAAMAGATRVTDVESSEAFNSVNALQWDRNAAALPRPVEHAVVADNVFDYLRAQERAAARYGMVVLDPPAFTKNRASREGAARGYNEINRMAFQLLEPAGVLVTCSCSHHLNATEFRDIVEGAAADAQRSVALVEARGAPRDHPVLFGAPESEYLKCLILAVD